MVAKWKNAYQMHTGWQHASLSPPSKSSNVSWQRAKPVKIQAATSAENPGLVNMHWNSKGSLKSIHPMYWNLHITILCYIILLDLHWWCSIRWCLGCGCCRIVLVVVVVVFGAVVVVGAVVVFVVVLVVVVLALVVVVVEVALLVSHSGEAKHRNSHGMNDHQKAHKKSRLAPLGV